MGAPKKRTSAAQPALSKTGSPAHEAEPVEPQAAPEAATDPVQAPAPQGAHEAPPVEPEGIPVKASASGWKPKANCVCANCRQGAPAVKPNQVIR